MHVKSGCAKHIMTVVALILTFFVVLFYVQCMFSILLWCRVLGNKSVVVHVHLQSNSLHLFSEV